MAGSYQNSVGPYTHCLGVNMGHGEAGPEGRAAERGRAGNMEDGDGRPRTSSLREATRAEVGAGAYRLSHGGGGLGGLAGQAGDFYPDGFKEAVEQLLRQVFH